MSGRRPPMSGRLLTALMDATPDGVVVVAADGGIVLANAAACALFGYDPGELAGREVDCLVPPRRRPAHGHHRAQYQQAPHSRMMGERLSVLEDGTVLTALRKDGSEFPVHVSLGPFQIDGEQFTVAIVRDVSAWIETEAALRTRTRQQAALVALSGDALATTSLDSLFEAAVTLVAETLEVRHVKVLELTEGGSAFLLRAGIGWADGLVGTALVPAGSESQAAYTLPRAEPVVVDDLSSETRFAASWLLADHGIVSGSSVVIPGKQHPFGVLGAHATEKRHFTEDDTDFLQGVANILSVAIERDGVERAIREGEEKYRTLVENIPAITYVETADGTGKRVYVSPQIETLLGVTPEEWRTGDLEEWLAYLHQDDRPSAEAAYREAVKSRRPLDIEYRAISRDGTVRWFRDTARAVETPGEAPSLLQGVMLDITEQKQAQEQLEESLAELERATEQRELLLSRLVRAQEDERQRIATDIHDDSIQVLTALALRLELLHGRIADDEARETFEDAVHTARRAVARLRHLIFELHPPALDRDGLAPALRMLLQQVSEEHGLETALHDDFDSEPGPVARAILYRVLREAVANVVRHARANTVTVRLAEGDRGHEATVADDGVGFDVDEARRRERPGHLGLPSMREQVELAGGSCTVRSEPGRGTTVEIFLPREL